MDDRGPAPTLLVLATYGLEIVEVGGTVALHTRSGGRAHAAVTLARPESRPQIERAAAVLGATVEFMDFTYGEVAPDVEAKKRFVRVIREVRPDVLITQDPEHSFHDLDPDRREAMILYLEAIALAGRDFAPEQLVGLQPHPIPTIYYMTPERPNCVVDITEVAEVKERALAALHLYHGLMSHTARAVLAEPFRREGVFTLPHLVR